MEWYIPVSLLVLVLIALWYIAARIQDVHLSLNSRLDNMLEEVRAAAYKAGETAARDSASREMTRLDINQLKKEGGV